MIWLIIVFSNFFNDYLYFLNELLHYLQPSYLGVVSGLKGHLESLSKWLIHYLNVHTSYYSDI